MFCFSDEKLQQDWIPGSRKETYPNGRPKQAFYAFKTDFRDILLWVLGNKKACMRYCGALPFPPPFLAYLNLVFFTTGICI